MLKYFVDSLNTAMESYDFLFYTGLIFWDIRGNEEQEYLNIIPQPKF